MYNVYKILTIILSPLINVYLYVRLIKKKEDKRRFSERFGKATIKRPQGDVIWFQCASVGEVNSVLPLIDEFIRKLNGDKITILITSGTVTSADVIAKKIKNNVNIIHQFTPIDTYFAIKKFLKYWKPKALITVESEIWPNMIIMTQEYCKNVFIVNGKMSKRSFKNWKKFKWFGNTIFSSINTCYTQTEKDRFRFINLGLKDVVFLGNIKFSIPKLWINDRYLNELKNNTVNREKILFASLHSEEKESVLNVINLLKETNKDKNLLFIFAIRHPNKSDEIYSYFVKNGYNVKRKSKNEIIVDSTQIYMCDVMGEMGSMFAFCKICVMCGAFIDGIGGHTPIEPAKQSCAIITPPYMYNNASLFNELENFNGCIICKNKNNIEEDVVSNINILLNDSSKVNELCKQALNTCDKFDCVLRNIAESIIYNIYK